MELKVLFPHPSSILCNKYYSSFGNPVRETRFGLPQMHFACSVLHINLYSGATTGKHKDRPGRKSRRGEGGEDDDNCDDDYKTRLFL